MMAGFWGESYTDKIHWATSRHGDRMFTLCNGSHSMLLWRLVDERQVNKKSVCKLCARKKR